MSLICNQEVLRGEKAPHLVDSFVWRFLFLFLLCVFVCVHSHDNMEHEIDADQ